MFHKCSFKTHFINFSIDRAEYYKFYHKILDKNKVSVINRTAYHLHMCVVFPAANDEGIYYPICALLHLGKAELAFFSHLRRLVSCLRPGTKSTLIQPCPHFTTSECSP